MCKKKILNEGYGLIPKSVMLMDLSIEAKAIYAFLCSFAGNKDIAYPSCEYIIKALKIGSHRFYKYKKELMDKGLITIDKKRENGKYSKNIYLINDDLKKDISSTNENFFAQPYADFEHTEDVYAENPYVENLHVENPHDENRHTNNNNSNINSTNINNTTTKSTSDFNINSSLDKNNNLNSKNNTSDFKASDSNISIPLNKTNTMNSKTTTTDSKTYDCNIVISLDESNPLNSKDYTTMNSKILSTTYNCDSNINKLLMDFNFRNLSKKYIQEIQRDLENYGTTLVTEALRISDTNNKHFYGYFKGVLNNLIKSSNYKEDYNNGRFELPKNTRQNYEKSSRRSCCEPITDLSRYENISSEYETQLLL